MTELKTTVLVLVTYHINLVEGSLGISLGRYSYFTFTLFKSLSMKWACYLNHKKMRKFIHTVPSNNMMTNTPSELIKGR